MPRLEEEITTEFIERLQASPSFTPDMIRELRRLFSTGKSPRPEQLVEVFVTQEEEGGA